MSIRIKLISIFLAIALIPLIFFSSVTFQNYQESLQAARLSQLKNIATLKAERITEHFNSLKSNIEIIQSFYNIKSNLPVLIRSSRNPSSPEFVEAKQMLDTQLVKVQSIMGLLDIMLVDPDGRVVYSSNPKHLNREINRTLPDYERDSFVQGKKRIYVSDVFRDTAENNRIEMLVAAPAINFAGAPIGVIIFEIDMKPVYTLLQDNTGLGRTGESLVVKKKGQDVIYLSDLKFTPGEDFNRILKIGGVLGIPSQRAVRGESGEGTSIDYRGKKVVAAWRYIPSLDWGLVTKMDAEEAYADIQSLKRLVFFILCIVAFLGGVMALSLAHSISDPIKKLAEGADMIGAGRLDHKVALPSKDEVGQLSRAFDKMTSNLKLVMASRDELDEEIGRRERAEEMTKRRLEELREANEELARFNRVAVGRELRMIELKKEINARCIAAGQPQRYSLDPDKEQL